MEMIAQVLAYMLPAGLVLLAVMVLLAQRNKERAAEREFALRQEVLRQHLPLKISAYERAILFLERISPENLLMRVNASGKQVQQFRLELIQEIRGEFEHNLAQQLYILPQGWEALVLAKEDLLSLINTIGQGLESETEAMALSKVLLQKYTEKKEYPIHKAILLLKQDIQRLFSLK